MKKTVNVKVQTGFFERTACKLNATAKGLTLTPIPKGGGETISMPAANVKVITFYEQKLKMDVQTDSLTEAYFADKDDWLNALKALKEALNTKIVCELN